MALPKRILLATDFSDNACNAEAAAVAWAARAGAKLHWIHALESAPTLVPYEPEFSGYVESVRAEVASKLAARSGAARKEGIEGSTHVGEAPPAQAISEWARSIEADLVVVGAHGRPGVAHWVVGSVAERTVRLADCDVLTVRGDGASALPKVIVVGYDFSEPAEAALSRAADLARSFGARLVVVHALDIGVPFTTAYEVDIPGELVDALRGGAWSRLEERVKRLADDGDVEVEPVVAPESARKALVAAAERQGAELIVTGSHGRSGIPRLLLGSVAEATLRHAPCSVLTVKPRS